MKTNFNLYSFTVVIVLMVLFQPSAKVFAMVQEQKNAPPQVSEGEAKILNAIKAAPDATAKLTGAEEFVKKYPKSKILPQLAQQIAVEIARVSDTSQKLALADRFQKTFTDNQALATIQSAKVDAYVGAKQIDEAFNLANTILTKDPEALHTLIQMTFVGTEEAKQKNAKYMVQTKQYGLKAIEVIEANKKPAIMDEASWSNDKKALPLLYQQTAMLAMLSGDPGDAKARLAKAIALDPADPSSYAFSGYLVNNEYVELATTYKTMPPGKQRDEMLVKLEGMLDGIIDTFAHAVGLATGRPEYQPLLNQVLPDLTSYYKFRHNQSVEGLQQLIDKYKTQPHSPPPVQPPSKP